MTLRIVLTHVYAWPEVRRGGERYLHELASALVRAGHSVEILTTTAGRPGIGVEGDVPVRYLRRRHVGRSHFGPLSDEAAFAVQAGARMALRPVDVWHALGTGDGAAASLLGRVRSIRSVYTDLGVPLRNYREGRPDRRLHRVVVRDVDAYVCLSRHACDALESGYGRRPLRIPGGVDLARFEPGRREGRPVILFSGAVDEPRKRVALLLEAVAILRRELPDLQLWLSGPGDAARLLSEAPPRAAEATVVLGTGQPGGQAAIYGRAWVTVLPSQHEAFGLALLESLACGTPVVATDDGGGPADLVEEGSGRMCRPDPDSIAEACRSALSLAGQPGTVGSCRAVASRYDWSAAIVPALERAYEGCG
jgi:phosphatidylinositol alpha-mannosyltransferase